MRKNIYKEKILNLFHQKHTLTMAQIQEELPQANFSTIFRNVEQLLEDQEIKTIVSDGKHSIYEAEHHAHDHFICTDCGEIEATHVPRDFFADKGYFVSDMTIRGICHDCHGGSI